uniref:MRN complex interacting protein n=1 Tax=Molossus molossus TaxID=27622 RepID=A0A7J8IA71_MOLMO|nr:MRN complex interacting protein [Molossus molossus]
MSPRSLEETVNAEKNEGPGQAEHVNLQGKKKQPSENCRLKYLERGSKELGLEGGVCFNRWPSTKKEKSDAPSHLPRKWTPPCNLDGQVSGDSEFTLETQKDYAGLAGKVKEGSSHEDRDTRKFTGPWVEPLCPAQQNGYKGIFLL